MVSRGVNDLCYQRGSAIDIRCINRKRVGPIANGHNAGRVDRLIICYGGRVNCRNCLHSRCRWCLNEVTGPNVVRRRTAVSVDTKTISSPVAKVHFHGLGIISPDVKGRCTVVTNLSGHQISTIPLGLCGDNL